MPTSRVVAVPDSEPQARRISCRLGRSLAVVESLRRADWPRMLRGQVSVYVVARARALDFDTVGSIIAASVHMRVPVGLRPLVDRPFQQASRPPDPNAGGSRVLLYSDFLPTGLFTSDVFGPASSDHFLRTASAGAEAIVLQSHGNGADVRIGTSVLCARVLNRGPAPIPGEAYLPCQAGGSCRLTHHQDFVSYHAVHALRARLLILLSCAGYQPEGGIVSFAHQLGAHWLGHPETDRALVTSSRLVFTRPELSLACQRALGRGLKAGMLALQLNRTSELGEPAYVCLGDPELSARGTAQPAAVDPRRLTRDDRESRPPKAPDYIDQGRATQALLVRLLDARDTAGGLAGQLEAAALSAAAGGAGELDHRLCRLLAEVIASRGADVYAALAGQFGVGVPTLTSKRHYCGQPIRRAVLPVPDRAARALHLCDRCGLVADVPPEVTLPTIRTVGSERALITFAGAREGWQTVNILPFGDLRVPPLPVTPLAQEISVPFAVDTTGGSRRFAVAVVADGEYEVYQGVIPASVIPRGQPPR